MNYNIYSSPYTMNIMEYCTRMMNSDLLRCYQNLCCIRLKLFLILPPYLTVLIIYTS